MKREALYVILKFALVVALVAIGDVLIVAFTHVEDFLLSFGLVLLGNLSLMASGWVITTISKE